MCCSQTFFINFFKLTCLLQLILSFICLAKSVQCSQYDDSLFINGLDNFKSNGWSIYISLFLVSFIFGVVGMIYAFTFTKCKWLVIITIILNLALVGYFSTLIAAKTITQSSVDKYIGSNLNDCETKPFFVQCQSLYTQSLNFWCQTPCPCAIEDPTKWEAFFWNNYVSNTGDPKKTFQDCSAFKQNYKEQTKLSDQDFTQYTNFLIAVEQKLQCSQMCKISQIFTFTEVGQGKPNQEKTCYEEYLSFINSFIGSFSLIGAFGTAVSSVQLFLQIMHLLTKNKKKIVAQNVKSVSLPKSNHDESYIKNKAQKDVL